MVPLSSKASRTVIYSSFRFGEMLYLINGEHDQVDLESRSKAKEGEKQVPSLVQMSLKLVSIRGGHFGAVLKQMQRNTNRFTYAAKKKINPRAFVLESGKIAREALFRQAPTLFFSAK
jgi:hypothetical protein